MRSQRPSVANDCTARVTVEMRARKWLILLQLKTGFVQHTAWLGGT